MTKGNASTTDLKLLTKDVDYIRKAVDKIDNRLERDYATKEELGALEARLSRQERITWFVASALFLALLGLFFSGVRITAIP